MSCADEGRRRTAARFRDSVVSRLSTALESARCPGRGTDGHGIQHCAECCFGSGWQATNADDLALLNAASDALVLICLLTDGDQAVDQGDGG